MSQNLQQYIKDKHIDGELLDLLNRLDSVEQSVLEPLLCTLNPSANTLRDIMRLATEIGARDEVEFSQVLSAEELQGILKLDGHSRKEKQKQVRSFLEQMRYPEITAIRKEISLCCEAVSKECGVFLEPPVDLEGDKLHLEIMFRSPAELSAYADRLAKAASHPETKKLFSILRGEV